MERATEAVKILASKEGITAIQELKGMGAPPDACKEVGKGVQILLKGEKKNHAWPACQKLLGNPAKFIADIQDFDGNNIDEWKLDMLKPLLALEFFTFEVMKGKSLAAAYLCSWIVNIVNYNAIYKKVKPLQDAAAEA